MLLMEHIINKGLGKQTVLVQMSAGVGRDGSVSLLGKYFLIFQFSH